MSAAVEKHLKLAEETLDLILCNVPEAGDVREASIRDIAEALAKAEHQGMQRAAEIISDGVERPVAVSYRTDGKPSKNDRCPHDFYVYEDCEQCCVSAILSECGEA